jgi:hypothetical protein
MGIMWIRLCNICGKRLDEEQRRFISLKNIKIFGFSNGRFYMENKKNAEQEISVCEICARNNPIWKIWEELK